MNIGLPSALLNPYYITFWKPFFEKLGLNVVITGETTKDILDKGLRYIIPEICIPIKVYVGHIIELLDIGTDKIYVPRFVSVCRGEFFCPKFMALPDMLKCVVPNLRDKMITHKIISTDDNIATPENYFEIGKLFTDDAKLIYEAIKYGYEKWREFRDLCVAKNCDCKTANSLVLNSGKVNKNGNYSVKIGVIGYVYNICDAFISANILGRLVELGAETVTFEMLDNSSIEAQLQHLPKSLFWSFSNKLLAGGYVFLEDSSIDGVIHITSFGCGPDAFLGKYFELDFEQYSKPFMTIRVDEHSGDNHLQTRIEAFVDMIVQKKSAKAAVQ